MQNPTEENNELPINDKSVETSNLPFERDGVSFSSLYDSLADAPIERILSVLSLPCSSESLILVALKVEDS